MTIPAIPRQLLEKPGDVLPRPHANCYWLIPGQLLAGEHPGSADSADGIARIDAMLDAGVRQCIDLTEEHEGPAPYVPIFLGRAAARNLHVAHRRFAIRDFGVPSPASMRATLDAIYDSIGAGEGVCRFDRAGRGVATPHRFHAPAARWLPIFTRC